MLASTRPSIPSFDDSVVSGASMTTCDAVRMPARKRSDSFRHDPCKYMTPLKIEIRFQIFSGLKKGAKHGVFGVECQARIQIST